MTFFIFNFKKKQEEQNSQKKKKKKMPNLFLLDTYDDKNSIFINALDEENRQHVIELTNPRRTLYCVMKNTVDSDQSALAIVKEQLVSVGADPCSPEISIYVKHVSFLHPIDRMVVDGHTIVQVIFYQTNCAMYDMFHLSSSSKGGGKMKHPMIDWVLGKNISAIEYLISACNLKGWFRFSPKDPPYRTAESRVYHRSASLSVVRGIEPQPAPPPSKPPMASFYWNMERQLGQVSGGPEARMTLNAMRDHLNEAPPAIMLVHDKESVPKELAHALAHTLVVDTYQFAKEFLPGKKDYTLGALVSNETTRSATKKTRAVEASINLVQLLFQISLTTGQPCSQALSKMGRIEWMLSKKFLESGCVPPDKPFSVDRVPYQAGMVLEPRKGIYTNPILYFDFMSLYPSICVENHICFSEDGRILPLLMKSLIETRRGLAERAKTCPATAIRRVCIKLLANAMYGCLASCYSRFYSIELAKRITSAGRQALVDAVGLIKSKFGLDTIYGDTDSLMVSTTRTDSASLARLAQRVVDAVNKHYVYMELQFEGVIDRLALFHKKCYACVKDGVFEIKGLDMVKRGYAPCGVAASNTVLKIMFDTMQEGTTPLAQMTEALGAIYEYTNTVLAPQLKKGVAPFRGDATSGRDTSSGGDVTDFVITTQLSKNPEQYESAAGLHYLHAISNHPQRVVFKKGDFVHYVMTTSHGPMLVDPRIQEVSSTYVLDTKWYTSHVLNMLDRLLSIYPAHKISSIFRTSASGGADYLSFLPPPLKLKGPSPKDVSHLKLRARLEIDCDACLDVSLYCGFAPLEQHLITREDDKRHTHVEAQEVLDALPPNLVACSACDEPYDLEAFMKALNERQRYAFLLSTDVHRACKQVACHHCQTIVWHTLKNAGHVSRFVSLFI